MIIGNFSLSEFDNLLNLLEGSPEALSQLNLDAFNRPINPQSPLRNVNLDNLAQPEQSTSTTTVVTTNAQIDP